MQGDSDADALRLVERYGTPSEQDAYRTVRTGAQKADVDVMANAQTILPEKKNTYADTPPKVTPMTTTEQATVNTPPTPASQSEDIDTLLRPVFTALDRKGSGALSALDMLHEIPQVSVSPAFQRAAQSIPRLQKLARPRSFRIEVQNMIGL